MPKIVDAEARRNEIADALFRIVARDGIGAVSLAAVAQESGLAIGSVRHFLGTRAELVTYAFDRMTARVRGRVEARVAELRQALADGATPADRLDAVVEVLSELLPLDESRRAEVSVWLEFETAARTDPALAKRSARAAAGTHRLVRAILDGAASAHVLRDDLDLGPETDRLTALVDGLSLRAVLHPELLRATTARAALTTHLASLRRGS